MTCRINSIEIKTNQTILPCIFVCSPSLSSRSAVKTALFYWLGCTPNLSFLFAIQCSTALCRYYIFKHPNFTTTTKTICYFIHYSSQCLFFTYYQRNYRHYCQLRWSILTTWPAYSGTENRKRWSGGWKHTCISSSSSSIPTARDLPLCGLLNLCIGIIRTYNNFMKLFLQNCAFQKLVLLPSTEKNIHHNMLSNSCGPWS